RHTRWPRDWSSDVCSSDLCARYPALGRARTPILVGELADRGEAPAALARELRESVLERFHRGIARMILRRHVGRVEQHERIPARSEERRVGIERAGWGSVS